MGNAKNGFISVLTVLKIEDRIIGMLPASDTPEDMDETFAMGLRSRSSGDAAGGVAGWEVFPMGRKD